MINETIRSTFDLGQPSPPISLRQELALLFKHFQQSNPSTLAGGIKCPYYTAIFTCSKRPLWMLGQLLAQTFDPWLPNTRACQLTGFPYIFKNYDDDIEMNSHEHHACIQHIL